MLEIYLDGDACPVRTEAFKVAARHGLPVTVVAARWMRVPDRPGIRLVEAGPAFDAADDWIAERAQSGDLVVTADILLADRCLKQGARVLSPTGQPFSLDSIGEAIAGRELARELRAAGLGGPGPAPLTNRDRSRFLQQLDVQLQSLKRAFPAAD